MIWKKAFIPLLVLSILLAACGGAASYDAAEAPSAARSEISTADTMAFAEEGEAATFDSDDAGFAPSPQEPGQAIPTERLIIRNGELNLVVVNTDEAIATITSMVESNGGWVVSSNVYQYNEDAKTGSITVRVPSTGFTSAIDAMKAMAVKVTNESTSGQDVTDEFVDLSLQLENLEATADRVRSFLDESRNVEEALAVNQELSRLEGDIERIKGRMQFLSESATYSTITVHLTPDVLSQPIEVAGWQPQGIAREAIEALLDALQSTGSFLIWVVIYLLPLALLYGIPLWLVIRFVVRWRRRRKQARTAVSETPTPSS